MKSLIQLKIKSILGWSVLPIILLLGILKDSYFYYVFVFIFLLIISLKFNAWKNLKY